MNDQARAYEPGKHPALPPPASTVGAVGWVREKLLSSPLNIVLSLISAYLIYLVVPPLVMWVFIDADWVGDSSADCSRVGACWIFIGTWFKQLMYGRYPLDELWRINTAYVLLIGAMTPLFLPNFRYKGGIAVFLLFVYPLIALYLFVGVTRETVNAWPFRLMGYSALGLGVVALLPLLNIMRERSAQISLLALVLVPIWGLSASSSWTNGLLTGVSGLPAAASIALTVLPPVALALALSSPWRNLVLRFFWQLCVLAAVLAFIGFELPLVFWEEVAGASPPWSMALTLSTLGLAAICVWGYDPSGAARVARLLLPVYLGIVWLAMAGPPDFLNFGALDWAPNTKPLFQGLRSVLPFVETPLWGGMFLTLVIAITGIVASLPMGILLALGRRSDMPIVRAICVAFIEFWRGIPLITVLFMSSVMFPLFMPEGLTFDKLLRALIGVALFSAAYMAEVVRGGLQAIPKGQFEGAQALGLSFWKTMALIIMPQALKLVIPGIVNTFIGLFKDTTLVLIIGLFDFLGMVQLAGTNPDWLGFSHEGYVFAAFGFWIFCFSMSQYSQHLEKKLHTGL